MVKIAVIGTGYVGLVAGTCLADFGMNVICVDNNREKIEGLQKGEIPIYEPGLESLIERNVYYKRLYFTTDVQGAIEESEVIFIAVGTPPTEDGSADLTYVMQVAQDIGRYMNNYKIVVDKSTVPVGTGHKVKQIITETLMGRGVDISFDVVSNPEFLREGSAVQDFIHPDRIVLGVESDKARRMMEKVYKIIYLNQIPVVETNIQTAEMIKYAANAFLALKIAYINELANLCECVGADIHHIAKAMGLDKRISPQYLQPGPGYGGSCFPKDTQALARIAQEHGSPVTLIEQTVRANEQQKIRMGEKVKKEMGDLHGKVIAILGTTFKPNTDDMREAPSLVIVDILTSAGAQLKVYDPGGEKESRWRLAHLKDYITFSKDEYDAIQDANGLVILTEWPQFRGMDLDRIKGLMKELYFFDFRNIYERKTVEEKGFKYYGVGR